MDYLNRKKECHSIIIPSDLYQKFKFYADGQYQSVSSVIRSLMTEKLKSIERDEKNKNG